jgi:cell division initiation protein
MEKITPIDIQHKTFKKALQGYDRSEVDQFLDEVIETLEDEAHHRAALEADIADLKERISHFKTMEESLQNTLLLAQRTADEVKASAHKEADLIREQARLQGEREIASYNDSISEVRREQQRAVDASEKARSELRSLLMTHLSLLEKELPPRGSAPAPAPAFQPAQAALDTSFDDQPAPPPSTDTTRIQIT